MHVTRTSHASAAGLRIGVVVSHYHPTITDALRDAAVETYLAAGGREDDLLIVAVPGAFELPVVCSRLAARSDVDAVVALGSIITGETTHDRHIADAVSQALAHLAVKTGKPISFGVLTCQSLDQAQARAGGDKGNKGAEAMSAAIEATRTIQALHSVESRS